VLGDAEQAAIVADALRDIAADPAQAGRSASVLYQDFLTRCRMRGLAASVDLPAFRRRLAMTRAGVEEAGFEDALALAAAVPEDMLAPFLLIARAARDGAECPSDSALADMYGTSSTGGPPHGPASGGTRPDRGAHRSVRQAQPFRPAPRLDDGPVASGSGPAFPAGATGAAPGRLTGLATSPAAGRPVRLLRSFACAPT
jgi:hypothetical protein